MDSLATSFDGVVGHCRTLEQHVQEPLSPVAAKPAEHSAKPHHAEKPSHLYAVEGDARRGAIACQRQCHRIGTVEGHRELPECGKGPRLRWIADLLIRRNRTWLDRRRRFRGI